MQSILEKQTKATNENGQHAAARVWTCRAEGRVSGQTNSEELLVFVGEALHFGEIEASCRSYQRGERGRSAQHSIGQLCRGLLVKGLYNWSYRQAEREIRNNRLVRKFVGYGENAKTLDHLTLWRFGRWVKQQAARIFFDATLRQVLAAHQAERSAVQMGDSFALRSRAHEQSRTELLRSAVRRLLHHLALLSTDTAAQVQAAVAQTALFGEPNEGPEHFLEKPLRNALELQTASAASTCLDLVKTASARLVTQQSHPSYRALQRWLGVLEKILHDEFSFTPGAAGTTLQAALRTPKEKGAYRHGSTVDLDATFRTHGDKTTFGYNAQLSATQHFITEIFASTGATPDGAGVAQLVANQKTHQGLVPHKLIYDRAAGLPKIFAQVAAASNQQTQLVARLIDHSQRSERFGPQAFSLNEQGALRCPNGQTSSRAYRSGAADGWTFRFLPEQCQGCALTSQCRGDQVKPSHLRQVFISDYRFAQRKALAYLQTPAFKLDMKQRHHIERIIAALVRYNGARQATGFGLANADFQLKMAAVAFNLKRWHSLHLQKQRAQRFKPAATD